MKKYFLTGLASLLPVAVTIWLVGFVVNFLTKPFVGIVSRMISRATIDCAWASESVVRGISQAAILVFFFLLLIFLGMVARWFIFTSVLKIGDYLIGKTPLINKVYNTAKEIINVLFTSNKNSFKQVVMVRFPNRGSYCLGLITREAPKTCSDAIGEELLSIFVPTTPNPMTGYLITTPKSDVIFLDMKPEDAIKYVVSCGVIQPEKRVPVTHS